MSDLATTYRHVAEADTFDEPFDWSEHTDGQDVDCFCRPRVEEGLVVHRREPISNEGWWDTYANDLFFRGR